MLAISVTNILNLTLTHFVTNIRHQNRCHPLMLVNLIILIHQLNSKKTNLVSSQIPKYSSSDAHNFKIDKVTDDDIPYDLLFSKSPSGDIRQDFSSISDWLANEILRNPKKSFSVAYLLSVPIGL